MAKSHHPRVYPTEEMVARAIVGGCKITGGDPVAVASGAIDPIGTDLNGIENLSIEAARARRFGISRGRCYAAFALRILYPEGNLSGIARACGARGGVAGSYFSALDQRLAKGLNVPWFDQAALDALVAEIRVPEVEPPARAESVKPPAPAKIEPAPVNKLLVDDDRPVFDRGGLGGIRKPAEYPRPRAMTKAEMEADLRAAIERTAAMNKTEV